MFIAGANFYQIVLGEDKRGGWGEVRAEGALVLGRTARRHFHLTRCHISATRRRGGARLPAPVSPVSLCSAYLAAIQITDFLPCLLIV